MLKLKHLPPLGATKDFTKIDNLDALTKELSRIAGEQVIASQSPTLRIYTSGSEKAARVLAEKLGIKVEKYWYVNEYRWFVAIQPSCKE